jgi:hypothetical protein
MNIETAIAALNKHGDIVKRKYKYYTLIRNLLKEEKATLVYSKWLNENKRFDWIAEPNIQKENTYDGCVDVTITTKDSQLAFNITVWDGDLYDGYPVERRCAFLVVTNVLPTAVEDAIISQLKNTASDLFEREEEERRRKRKQELFDNLLNNLTTDEPL